MGSNFHRTILLTLCLVCAFVASPVLGVTPADRLLPDNTCLYVSFPEMPQFEKNFLETQLGKLVNDPVMKPFAEDLADQIRSRFGQTEFQLGLTWDDMEGIFAGEACLARTQPGKNEHAVILLVDVTGHVPAAEKLRGTIAANLKKRNATQSKIKLGATDVDQFQLKKEVWEVKAREVFFAVVDNQMIVTNHRGLATEVIQIAEGGAVQNRLADSRMFAGVMSQIAEQSGELSPDVRWFVDPFTYSEVVRDARSQRKRTRGKNFTEVLKSEGFDAVRCVGGHVNLATADFEIVHRTFVFAPPVTDQPTKYNGAARMLNFPATRHLPLPKWVPRDVATLLSTNWNVLNGFNYATSLIDQIVDSEGFVEDVLDSFEKDLKINIRTSLLAHFDDHILTFSDYELPITTKSERLLVAIRVKDEKAVIEALEKLWIDEPDAQRVEIGKHVVWELVPETVDLSDIELPTPGSIPLPGSVPLPGGETAPAEEDENEVKLPNAAMTVARGPEADAEPYLFVATSIRLLEQVLAGDRPPHEMLGQSIDFQIVNRLLDELGAGEDSFRFFSRTDEEYRSTYELIRQGKMPESESLLGRVLNRLLGPQEENVLRKPEIDGRKMPEYQIVRRYLGPAGLFVKPREDGWFVTGIMVSKDKLASDQEAQARLTTAPDSGLGNK